MSDERDNMTSVTERPAAGRGLGRWGAVAALIVAGIVLFFVYGRQARPAVEPSIEAGP